MTSDHSPQEDAAPRDLARWALHCFAPTARRTPHALVAEGDNGRLLYEARAGTTVTELARRGVRCTDDQLQLLAEFGLVERRGDTVRTAFPVLGPATMRALRERLGALAHRTAESAEAEARALGAELARQGLADSTYAVVFGHALDGLLWDRLAVPDTALSPQRPWWNGAFWALHPAREGAAGTNFVDCDGATLTLVWTPATTDRLAALADAPGLRAAARSLTGHGHPDRPAGVTDRNGRTWRLRRPDGRPALPVVGTGGPLDRHARRLADRAADALSGPEATAAGALVSPDHRIATVVIAHEFIWDVAHHLTAAGACPLPPAMRRPPAEADTLLDLLFLRVDRR
ncbi:hypothetical protein [Streptomyces litchfieldiae]|uniref:Uncharacterized protein n=1 Tax=Streptomyces litchfieldiae TaxID=3075543 RepID=A0ABU2MZZ3_9ACTN|nr:hypothetical protein [Streptomyces sp. DSM 44938]MDT0347205.1 hypothetical protein [Streptomyces sp. DSM 44938]